MKSTTKRSDGRAACRALSDETDAWLVSLYGDGPKGVALVAAGGYGRQELAPGSDLDVWLVHDGVSGIDGIAERLWYPIWDSGRKLGHAVWRVDEALSLAARDLDTATAALSVRCIAGDASVAERLHTKAVEQWRKGKRLRELHDRVLHRHAQEGEVAFLLEPDLKEGRGGLRDVHALRWAELATPMLDPADDAAVSEAEDVLLDIRVALHRRAGRATDTLTLELQDDVAKELGDRDADALMARLATAARAVAWIADDAWRRHVSPKASTMKLPEGADLDDPSLPLRVAAAAVHGDVPIDRGALEAMAARTPSMPDPWPDPARRALVDTLAGGPRGTEALEALDQYRLFERALPEWSRVRNRPQRNALHRFTVDRHLLECAAVASRFTNTVARPDLLLLGALLHDIGKGSPGDHTDAGVELVTAIGARMGFAADDVTVLVDLVRHHLLLPDVATRRDLTDEDVINGVAAAVGSLDTLGLLAALSEADGLATGPSAWGEWKAELVRDLVSRVAHVLRGGDAADLAGVDFPGPELRALLAKRRVAVRVERNQLTVVAPDRPGLFSRVAGTLALKGLTVLAAKAGGEDGMAASQFRVDPGDAEIDWEEVVEDVRRAVEGRLALEARLAARTRKPRRATTAPSVRIDNNASGTSTIVEVHAPDRLGVLYNITRALADLDLDIQWANIATLGDEVVDAFYVRTASGGKVVERDHIRELERAILHRLSL